MRYGRLDKYNMLVKQSGENPSAQRILAQLGFLLELSHSQQGRFDDTILPQIERLFDAVKREGAITYTSATQVERDLSLLGTEAKRYRVHCVIQPKIDPSEEEDLVSTIGQVRHALALLEQFKETAYFEPRAAVYRLLETQQPLLFAKVKEQVTAGRWEVGLTSWDNLLPRLQSPDEALFSLRENRTYLADVLEIPPKTLRVHFQLAGYSTTPHCLGLLAGLGIPFDYCYGAVDQNQLAFAAKEGNRVIRLESLQEPHSGIYGELKLLCNQLFATSHRRHFFRVVELDPRKPAQAAAHLTTLRELAGLPLMGKMEFVTVAEFFQLIQLDGGVQKLLTPLTGYGDFGFFHQPYSQSQRSRENQRTVSGTMDSFATMLSTDYQTPYPMAQLETGRLDLGRGEEGVEGPFLINAEHAQNTLCLEMNTSELDYGSEKNTGFEQVTFAVDQDQIQYRPALGKETAPPYVYTIFNTSQFACTKVIQLTVPRWEAPLQLLYLQDYKGREIPFQIEKKEEDGSLILSFLAKLPQFGYLTFQVVQREQLLLGEADPLPSTQYVGGGERVVLENQHLLACFSAKDMLLTSLVSKKTGEELLGVGQVGGQFLLELEEQQNQLLPKAAAAKQIPLNSSYPVYIKEIFFGDVRCWVAYEIPFEGSRIVVRVSLDQGAKALGWEVDVDWVPRRLSPKGDWRLTFGFPFQLLSTDRYYGLPWSGVVNPQGEHALFATEFVAPLPVTGEDTLLLMGAGHHSFVASGGVLTAKLITRRTAANRGNYFFKLGVGVAEATPYQLMKEAKAFLLTPLVVQSGIHRGSLPACGQLMTTQGEGILSACWSAALGAGFYLRFTNPSDNLQPMVLDFVRPLKHVTLVDFQLESYEILHRPLLTRTEFVLPPEGVITLKVLFE